MAEASESRRATRMREVLDQRLAHVHCAVEAVYHRHNVSAILRTCDALGVHTVHLVSSHATHPRSEASEESGPRGGRSENMRVSKGPARGAERWLDLRHHPDTRSAIDALRAEGVALWVADLAPDSVAPEGVPLARPVCLWFGAELVGVSPEARAAADGVVTVPMRGMAQSLNVSVAAAMCLRAVADRARGLEGSHLSEEARSSTLSAWLRRDQDTAHRILAR